MREATIEQEALQALARGEVSALGELHDAHADRVYHVLIAAGVPEDEAQDVVQEAFLSLLDRGRGVIRIRSATAYLIRTARNIAARAARRRGTRETEAEAPEAGASHDPTGAIAAKAALRQLPREQAEVMVLKVWHEMTFAEIAEALSIPPDTAASRYRYAIAKLRHLWGEDDHETR